MRNDPRWGIVALLGASALILVALFVIAEYPTLLSRGDEYRTIFSSVAGLNEGDEVRYGGLKVGWVTDMELDPRDPRRIIVEFKVKGRTPIRTNTLAQITQVGLLGEPYLNLQSGRAAAPELPPGSVVPSEQSMSFQDAMNRLAMFLDRADTLITGVERLSRSSPWERIDRTLQRFEQLVNSTATSSEKVLAQLDVASRQLTRVLDETERLVGGLDTTFRGAAPGLASTQREALATLRETRALVAEVRDALDAGGGVDQMVRNLATAAENVAQLTSRLERDPTSVLQRRATPRKTVGPPVRGP